MLNIFAWIRGRNQVAQTAAELYGSIVTQARQPVFYRHYKVPDVAEKRYEMIVLHMVLVLERLRKSDADAMQLGQELIEAFVGDLDGSIREMAIGDTKVPGNVKKAAAGLMDRDILYRQAFESSAQRENETDDMTLEALLDELVFEGGSSSDARQLARYVWASRLVLEDWKHRDGVENISFADPSALIAE